MNALYLVAPIESIIRMEEAKTDAVSRMLDNATKAVEKAQTVEDIMTIYRLTMESVNFVRFCL